MTDVNGSRRNFLRTGAAAVGAVSVGLLSPTKQIQAAKFNNHHIKLSLAAYSFRNQFRNENLTMEEFIDFCVDLGLDGTELTSYFFESTDNSYLLSLRNKCFHLGIPISGTAIGNDFVTPKESERRKQIGDVKGWIDRAVVLGAPSIRVFGGGPIPDGYSEENVFDWVIPAMKECVEYASTKGIVLAIENHGGFPMTSTQVIRIVQEVDSPWFGVNLDTGNFLSDWYRQMAEVIPYTVVVQFKVNLMNTVKGAPRIAADPERIVRMLENEGYRRYLVLEYEEDNPYQEIPEWIEHLQKIVA